MIDAPRKPSDTARAALTVAATRADYLVRPPKLPVAAARQVVRSLLNNGLVEEVAASIDDPAYIWREAEDGARLNLRATDAGLTAIGHAAHATVPMLPETDEAQTMIREGLANGRSEAQVAEDTVENQPATDAPTAPATPRTGRRPPMPPSTSRPTAPPLSRPSDRTCLWWRGPSLMPGMTTAIARRTLSPPLRGRWPTSVWPLASARTASQQLPPTSRAKAPSTSRFWRCCAARRAPAGRRLPRRWAGHRTPSGGSSPA
jgi:hypothetical protein